MTQPPDTYTISVIEIVCSEIFIKFESPSWPQLKGKRIATWDLLEKCFLCYVLYVS